MFILETMANKKNMMSILPKVGFEHFDYVEPVNHFGGLAVLCNNGTMYASILRKEQRAIHMLVHDTEKVKLQLLVACMHQHSKKKKTHFESPTSIKLYN